MSKPNWTPIQIRLGDLIPWGDNPKYSTKEDAKRLLETEQEFGQPIPFCVSREVRLIVTMGIKGTVRGAQPTGTTSLSGQCRATAI
jgi:hypothetical protein